MPESHLSILEGCDDDSSYIQVPVKTYRKAVLALLDCEKLLLLSGQLELNPPKSLVNLCADNPQEDEE